MSDTTGNSSSSRAPARYSGAGGPGTLVTGRFTVRWRARDRHQARWTAASPRTPLPVGGRALALPAAVSAAISSSRRTGSGSPSGSGTTIADPWLPLAALARSPMERGGHHHAQHQPLDGLAAAGQQPARGRDRTGVHGRTGDSGASAAVSSSAPKAATPA